jgi:hypothetical protein
MQATVETDDKLADELITPSAGSGASDEDSLRSFIARILGWAPERAEAVDHAIHSLDLAADHHAALVLLSETDLVPIARALHRRVLGADRPLVVAIRDGATARITKACARRSTTGPGSLHSRQRSGAPCACAATDYRAITRPWWRGFGALAMCNSSSARTGVMTLTRSSPFVCRSGSHR